MNRRAFLLVSILALGLASAVSAAPAQDAVSCGAHGDTDTLSWTHTPAGTPRGAIFFVIDSDNADNISALPTYGGVNMTQTANSPQIGSGVLGTVHAFFLGAGLPTGAQTVSVTVGNAAAKVGCVVTFTASANMEVIGTAAILSGSDDNPATTLALAGRTSVVAEAFFSGSDAISSNTPPSGWTSAAEGDFGSFTDGIYTYNTVASTDVTVGYTAAADIVALIAVGVAEIVVPVSGGLTTLGAG